MPAALAKPLCPLCLQSYLSFNRTHRQSLNAGSRTLNIASNGGMSVVAMFRVTGSSTGSTGSTGFTDSFTGPPASAVAGVTAAATAPARAECIIDMRLVSSRVAGGRSGAGQRASGERAGDAEMRAGSSGAPKQSSRKATEERVEFVSLVVCREGTSNMLKLCWFGEGCGAVEEHCGLVQQDAWITVVFR